MEINISDILENLQNEAPEYSERRHWIPTYRGDLNLSSALSDSYSRHIQENIDNPRLPSAIRDLYRFYAGSSGVFSNVANDRIATWKCIYATIDDATGPLSVKEKAHWMRDIYIADRLTRMSVSYLSNLPLGTNSNEIPPLAPVIEKNNLILHLVALRNQFDKMLQKVSRSTQERMTCTVNGKSTFSFVREEVFFKCSLCMSPHVASYNDFLCASDINLGRLNILVYTALRDSVLHTKTYDIVVKTLSNMDQLLTRYGQKAYNIFKVMPSFATAAVLRDKDPLGDGGFLESLKKGLSEDIPGVEWDDDIAYFYRPVRRTQDVFDIIECSGLWKMAGHPTVDYEAGIKKVLDEGFYHKVGLEEIGERISATFTYLFCKHYHERHGTWPNLDLSRAPHCITQAVKQGVWPEEFNARPPLHLFTHIKLKKTLTFNMYPDLSELIADTSITGGLHNWHYENPPEWMHRVYYGTRYLYRLPRDRKNKPILVYLEEDEHTLAAILDLIDRNEVPEDWYIIVLVAKERELKRKARYFAKNTYEIRLWQVATEKGIAEVLKYLPYQSMTMSDDVLQRKLLAMSRAMTTKGTHKYSHVSVIVDFSSWNLQFRHNTMFGLLDQLDGIFGFQNVYKFTHILPMRSCTIVKDPGVPVKEGPHGRPLPGPRCWYGQESYYEGLRQKGWTLYTLCLIQSVAVEGKYEVTMLGQGDNQAILIEIPVHLRHSSTFVISYVQRFLDDLKAACDQAQIPMKVEETWRSSVLFEYGRVSFFDGMQVPSSIKKVGRMGMESNNLLSSMASHISGVFSSGVAVAGLDSIPHIAYFVAILGALRVLRLFGSDLYNREDVKFLEILLQIPTVLGGLPISPLMSYCIRGCPDPLTESLAYFKWIWESYPDYRPYIRALMRLEPARRLNSLLHIQDPIALNLERPDSAENTIRKLLLPGIQRVTKNQRVLNLFSSSADSAQEKLVRDLLSIQPQYPRVNSAIFALSDVALRSRFIGRFTHPISVMNVATVQVSTYPELWGLVSTHDRTLIAHFNKRVNSADTRSWNDLVYSTSNCTYEEACKLRERHWGPHDGVTMPAPREQIEIIEWDDPRNLDGDAIRVHVEVGTRHALYKLGPYRPYLGHDTSEKVSKNPLDMGVTTSVTEAAIRITTLFPWVVSHEDPNLQALFRTLLREKGVDLHDALTALQPMHIRGSLYHRIADPRVSHGARTNSSSVLGTHILISTDNFISVAKSAVDKTFFFQGVLTYILAYFRLRVVYGGVPEGDYAVRIKCPGCLREITDPAFHMPFEPSYQGLYVPADLGIIRPLLKDIPPFPANESGVTLFSWAVGRLAVPLLAGHIGGGIQSYSNQGLNITNLSLCDPQSYIQCLVYHLYHHQRHMRSINRCMISRMANRLPQVRPGASLLVANLFTSGLLERIFLSFSWRGSGSGWMSGNREATRSFLAFLVEQIANPSNIGYPPDKIYLFPTDQEKLGPESRGCGNSQVVRCPFPETIIGLCRKEINPTEIQGPDPAPVPRVGCTVLMKGNPIWSAQLYANMKSLHYMTRVLGKESSAMTKLCEILGSIQTPDEVDACVCIAEGLGGFLQYLGHLFPRAELVYNSLTLTAPTNHSTCQLPSCIYGDPCGLSKRVVQYPYLTVGATDLVLTVTWQKLHRVVDKYQHVFFTCDVDSVTCPDNYRHILSNVVDYISRATNISVFLIKLMASSSIPNLDRLQDTYHCSLVFPLSSNPFTGECYVIGYPSENKPSLPNPYDAWRSMMDSRLSRLDELDSQVSEYGLKLLACGVPQCLDGITHILAALGISRPTCESVGSIIPHLQTALTRHTTWIQTIQADSPDALLHVQARPNEASNLLGNALDVCLEYLILITALGCCPLNLRTVYEELSGHHTVRVLHVHGSWGSLTVCNRHCREALSGITYTLGKLTDTHWRTLCRLYTYELYLKKASMTRYTPPSTSPCTIHEVIIPPFIPPYRHHRVSAPIPFPDDDSADDLHL